MNNIYKEICQRCCPYCDAECDGCWLEELINKELEEERKRVIWEIRKRAKRTQFYIEPTEKSPTGKQKGFIYEFSDRLLDQIERSE